MHFAELLISLVLYTLMRSITKVIQYIHTYKTQVDSVVSDTNGFINIWLRSLGDTRKETQFLKVFAYHTMLTPHQRAVHLGMFKISIHLCWSRSEKLNHNSCLNGPISTDVSLKSSNSLEHFFWAWRHPHSSSVSCLGVYYDKWWLSYPFLVSVDLHPMMMHLDSKHE